MKYDFKDTLYYAVSNLDTKLIQQKLKRKSPNDAFIVDPVSNKHKRVYMLHRALEACRSHYVSDDTQVEVFHLLLKHKCNANEKVNGVSIFQKVIEWLSFYQTSFCAFEICVLLLKYGASANFTCEGKTPLYYLTKYASLTRLDGFCGVIKLLVINNCVIHRKEINKRVRKEKKTVEFIAALPYLCVMYCVQKRKINTLLF